MIRLDWRWTLATASLGIALASPAAVAQVPADESLAAASSVRGLGYPGKAAHVAPTRAPISSWFTRRAQSYAGVINGLYDAVKEQSRVFSVVVPTGRALAGFKRQSKSYRTVEEQLWTVNHHLTDGIHGVDALSTMERHADEYLYFRTDHHWTALGAYYAYRSLCESAGIEPLPLHSFEKRHGSRRFLGSLYRRNKTLKMRRKADKVDYYVPPVTHEAVRYSRLRPKRPVSGSFLREGLGGYKMFLGGDYPLMVANTSVQNGKRVMLVKNSYGNPFAIFLLSHYERVVVVDYRYQKRPIPELIKEHDIDDLVFLNVSSLSASKSHQRHLHSLIRGKR
jgi:hypothetical protein